jgi:hypothetical protein
MMQQHPELNFYGAPWGFLKHNLETTTFEDFDHDMLTWTNVGEVFKLAPEHTINFGLASQHAQTSEFRDKYINEIPY